MLPRQISVIKISEYFYFYLSAFLYFSVLIHSIATPYQALTTDLSLFTDISQGVNLNNDVGATYVKMTSSNYYISRLTSNGKLQIYDLATNSLKYNVFSNIGIPVSNFVQYYQIPQDDNTSLITVYMDGLSQIYTLNPGGTLSLRYSFSIFYGSSFYQIALINSQVLSVAFNGNNACVYRFLQGTGFTACQELPLNFLNEVFHIKTCKIDSNGYRFAVWKTGCYLQIQQCQFNGICTSIYSAVNGACTGAQLSDLTYDSQSPFDWSTDCTKVMYYWNGVGVKVENIITNVTIGTFRSDCTPSNLRDIAFMDAYSQFMILTLDYSSLQVYDLSLPANPPIQYIYPIDYTVAQFNRFNNLIVVSSFPFPYKNDFGCSNPTLPYNDQGVCTPTPIIPPPPSPGGNISTPSNVTNNITNNVTNLTNSSVISNNSNTSNVINNNLLNNFTRGLSLQQFQNYQNLMQSILANDVLQTLNSVPGSRKLLKPIFAFFINFDDLWLYNYHPIVYNRVINTVFLLTQNLQSQKWSLIPFQKMWSKMGVDTQYLKQVLNYKEAYTSEKFKLIQGNSNGFFINSVNLFFSNAFLMLGIYLILRLLYCILNRFKIGSLIKGYDYWVMYLIMFLQGNLQYLSFLYTFQISHLFSFKFVHKLNLISVLAVYLFFLIFSIGVLLIFKSYYGEVTKYIADNVNIKIVGIVYCGMIVSYKNILLGVIHYFLDQNYILKLGLLIGIQVIILIITIKIFTQKVYFEYKTKVCIFINTTVIRVFIVSTFIMTKYSSNNNQLLSNASDSATSLFQQILQQPHLILIYFYLSLFLVSIVSELLFLFFQLKQIFCNHPVKKYKVNTNATQDQNLIDKENKHNESHKVNKSNIFLTLTNENEIQQIKEDESIKNDGKLINKKKQNNQLVVLQNFKAKRLKLGRKLRVNTEMPTNKKIIDDKIKKTFKYQCKY